MIFRNIKGRIKFIKIKIYNIILKKLINKNLGLKIALKIKTRINKKENKNIKEL